MEVVTFLEATVRLATPLALAAVGETVTQRAGVINVGLEGAIMAGCFGAVVGGAAGAAGGLMGGVLAGLLVGVVFAVLVVRFRADAIIVGMALTVGSYGATGALARIAFGQEGVALTLPSLAPTAIPGLSRLPVVGAVLFSQSVVTYLLGVLIAVTWWGLYRTKTGLALRAVGDYPPAVLAAGLHPGRLRTMAILFGTALGGLAGATLVLTVGTFSEQMSAGRGFIALAVVALGRWTPLGTMGAALLFGGALALQYGLQSANSGVPYQAFLALPYVLTLVVLSLGAGRGRAPGWLGKPW